MNVNEKKIYRFEFPLTYFTGAGLQQINISFEIFSDSRENAASQLAGLLGQCSKELSEEFPKVKPAEISRSKPPEK